MATKGYANHGIRLSRYLMHGLHLLFIAGIIFILFFLTYTGNGDLMLYLVLSVSSIVLGLSYAEYRSRSLRDDCKRLKISEIEAKRVLRQKISLGDRNKEIVESLTYAHRIQTAMFTGEPELHRLFPDSFVFQRPKDIVSGDFFWAKEIGSRVFFSLADCTGHGVPGAFMSLIGQEFIRQIVIERRVMQPSLVLSEIEVLFRKVFSNSEQLVVKDGMDMSFCSFDREKMELEFSGAFHTLYIVRKGEILEIKGDKKSLGPDIDIVRGPFTNHRIQLEEEDAIYMFSDGYVDQFGGPAGKKFKYRRFRHQILTINKLPSHLQKKVLEENFLLWKGALEQIDDIMILGIRPASYNGS